MPAPRHVCLITGAHIWRNPRLVKEADALAAAGFRVTVVGPSLIPADQARDEGLLAARPWPRVTVPDLPAASPLVRQWSRLERRLSIAAVSRLGLQLDGSLGYSVEATLRAAEAVKADLYSCHLEVGLVALDRLTRRGALCSVDFEDWYSRDLLPSAQRERPIRRLRALEDLALHRAAVTSTTSDALAGALAAEHGARPPLTIYNAFRWSDRQGIDGKRLDRRDPDAVSLHWVSQTTGPGRGLEPLIDALDRLRGKVELHIRGDGSAEYQESLRLRLAPERRDSLFFHPTTAPADLLSRIAEHDIGLALDRPTPASRDLTITNKVFHSLLGGAAVVATPTAGNREIARVAPQAIVLAEEGDEAIAAAIQGLIDNPARLAAAKAAALEAAAGPLSWERVSQTLIEAYQAAITRAEAARGR
ncbi:glycosyltransferase [Caulobacter sp. SLTY]|uniref:glycosyltransferase n=1 Tax=Caulobacter sp. SLTY TaxID=2683262 RepID=UPI001412E117|nr:glycosyltransferase [Caulobacter sp. SLTY]NBB16045.1 glycosyltransferase [Caulobacter sp. SLTY]